MPMTKKQAVKITHTLSQTSKMPGKSYSIPARYCQTGSKLRQVPGSVCADCYACKGAYSWSTTQVALEKRYASLSHPQWVEAMTTLIKGETWFRWHDSGDIQSVDHLIRIVMVCENTPTTRHWLPTKERAIVKEYLDQGYSLPSNLIVRISAPKVNSGQLALMEFAHHPQIQSCRTVTRGVFNRIMQFGPGTTVACPSSYQGNQCGDCRSCWNTDVLDVAYLKH